MQDTEELFKKHFGARPTYMTRAPGRLEMLGNHTDYNDGVVMAVAVDKYINIAASPRTDGKIELISSAFKKPEVFTGNKLEKNPEASWANYVKGVLDQLRKRGVHYSGFSAAIHSTLPMGCGMSSSAALEVATALAVRKLFPYTLTETGLGAAPSRNEKGEVPPLQASERMLVAKLCKAAENEFVGVNCGLLDQVSSLFGKAWNVISIDCQSYAVEHSPLAGEAIIVCDSGVRRELVAGAYNELRRNCEDAAKKLGAKSLRSVDMKRLLANKHLLEPREFECAHHIVSEIARVVAGEKALHADDHEQYGQYMFQSHESSRDFLKNSCKELDILVDLARNIPGCLGARLSGGGFGGATIHMVGHHQAAAYMATIARQYEERTGRKSQPVICQVVEGAN
jgi:galactokinase